jgi:ubiquinone/menaquinone biosynthesis C-methylase UbiE
MLNNDYTFYPPKSLFRRKINLESIKMESNTQTQKDKIIEIYKKEDVAKIFDKDRSKYSYQKYKHKIESNLLTKTISDVPFEEVNILDVACGTGRMLPEVFNTKKKIIYVGLDTSDRMIDELKKKEVYLKNKKSIKLILSDAEKLPFKDNAFDIVCTYHLLWHIPEKEQRAIIAEMLRITKKGGVIIFDILNKDFIWENLKKYLGKKEPEGLYKQRIPEIKKILGDVDNIEIEKLSDAIIKKDLFYSLFNLINRLRIFLPPSFFHMIYFKVKK